MCISGLSRHVREREREREQKQAGREEISGASRETVRGAKKTEPRQKDELAMLWQDGEAIGKG